MSAWLIASGAIVMLALAYGRGYIDGTRRGRHRREARRQALAAERQIDYLYERARRQIEDDADRSKSQSASGRPR